MNWTERLEVYLNEYDKRKLDEFKRLTHNYERVEFLIGENYLMREVDEVLKNLPFEGKKSNKLSDEYRSKGNEHFSKKNFSDSFNFYTLAVSFAECDSKSSIFAYSNRSAVFFSLELFENCLKDLKTIENKLSNSNPFEQNSKEFPTLLIKLVTRQINCYFHLKKVELLQDYRIRSKLYLMTKETKPLQLDDIDKLINKYSFMENMTYEEALQIEKKQETPQQESLTRLSECIEIKYTKTQGRFCVAKREVDMGECLIVENAYCAILLPEFSTHFCQLCFKCLYRENQLAFEHLNIESCTRCSNVLYCSEQCKQLAEMPNSFHSFECGVLGHLLHNLGIAHLAYRILTTTSYEMLVKYGTLEMEKQSELNEKELLEINYNSKESDYEQVYNLVTHESSTHFSDLFKYSLTSLLLAKNYLNHRQKKETTDLKIISSLLLRHLLQTICNAHAITKLRDDAKSDLSSSTFNREQIRFATALYPRVSLLNHSCNPNVISSFRANSTTIEIHSSRRIGKSDEIFNCYGPHSLKMSLFERQQSLMEQYHFECRCEDCLTQMESAIASTRQTCCGLRCLNCQSEKCVLEMSNLTNMHKMIVKCKNCDKGFDLKKYSSLFDSIETEFKLIDFNNNQNNENNLDKVKTLIDKLRRHLLIKETFDVEFERFNLGSLNDFVKPFYLKYSEQIDLMSRLNCNLGKFHEASRLTELNTNLLEFVYPNGMNVEIAHELFKLAEIQCNCRKFQKALRNIEKAIEIAKSVYSSQSEILSEFLSLRANILSVLG